MTKCTTYIPFAVINFGVGEENWDFVLTDEAELSAKTLGFKLLKLMHTCLEWDQNMASSEAASSNISNLGEVSQSVPFLTSQMANFLKLSEK